MGKIDLVKYESITRPLASVCVGSRAKLADTDEALKGQSTPRIYGASVSLVTEKSAVTGDSVLLAYIFLANDATQFAH